MIDIQYWKDGTKIIEDALNKVIQAKTSDAPFPLCGDEAKLWHRAQAEAYQYALEMMGYPGEV